MKREEILEFIELTKRELVNARLRALEIMPLYSRKTRRNTRIHGSCKGCGRSYDSNTPGCRTCYARHAMRKHIG